MWDPYDLRDLGRVSLVGSALRRYAQQAISCATDTKIYILIDDLDDLDRDVCERWVNVGKMYKIVSCRRAETPIIPRQQSDNCSLCELFDVYTAVVSVLLWSATSSRVFSGVIVILCTTSIT